MTLFGADLVVMLVVVAIGFALNYFLLLRRLKAMVTKRHLRIANQISALDDAICALKRQLSEHQVQATGIDSSRTVQADELQTGTGNTINDNSGESGEIAPEIQAAIAAAAAATLGPNAVVNSVTLSPWSQQGRVMVQGGRNLRVPR